MTQCKYYGLLRYDRLAVLDSYRVLVIRSSVVKVRFAAGTTIAFYCTNRLLQVHLHIYINARLTSARRLFNFAFSSFGT